jgi:CDP-glucose 4,6-dehydratase
MENLGLASHNLFGGAYKGRRIVLTGHTGFKGSWLALWLTRMGAEVTGIDLPPETQPSHWDLLGLKIPEFIIDMRDSAQVARAVRDARPDLVIHMAAQSLVRRSYRAPADTWGTNIMGSVNVLEACRDLETLKGVLIITSDKVYANKESKNGYIEEDTLGGHDPYSASKAATELLVKSYRSSFFNRPGAALLATARAGNVIGGGDWAEDRLIADAVRAQMTGEDVVIRNPGAVRPWQHVLEPLSAYLMLGQGMLSGKANYASAWNVGPESKNSLRVSDVLDKMKHYWPDLGWNIVPDHALHETAALYLDSTKIKAALKWTSVMTIDEHIHMTAEWYRAFIEKNEILSEQQLLRYCLFAQDRKAPWVST